MSNDSAGSKAEPVSVSVMVCASTTCAATPTGPENGGSRSGWEYVHVCVDDYSRLAYVEVLPDEKAVTAAAFLRRAVTFYRRHGIRVERVLTDNGSPYVSTVHAVACRALGVRHSRTRPYRPQTNGKAERFIRTMLQGWAYGAIYGSSNERTAALDGWLWHYNHRRRHSALGHQPPASRTNLLGSYT
jgi:transposase InsO family protein